MSPKEGIEGKRRKYDNKQRSKESIEGEGMEQAVIVGHFLDNEKEKKQKNWSQCKMRQKVDRRLNRRRIYVQRKEKKRKENILDLGKGQESEEREDED